MFTNEWADNYCRKKFLLELRLVSHSANDFFAHSKLIHLRLLRWNWNCWGWAGRKGFKSNKVESIEYSSLMISFPVEFNLAHSLVLFWFKLRLGRLRCWLARFISFVARPWWSQIVIHSKLLKKDPSITQSSKDSKHVDLEPMSRYSPLTVTNGNLNIFTKCQSGPTLSSTTPPMPSHPKRPLMLTSFRHPKFTTAESKTHFATILGAIQCHTGYFKYEPSLINEIAVIRFAVDLLLASSIHAE